MACSTGRRAAPGAAGWVEGSFRFPSYEAAAQELLALGADVEVLLPVSLRRTMADLGRHVVELHA